MKSRFFQWVCKLLMVSMVCLPMSSVQAGVVGTDQLLPAAQAQADRARVRDFVSRADVARQLQALGIQADVAKQRVDTLTDEEVQQIAGKLDTLPAGAMSGWAWAAIVIVIAAIIWYVYYK